MFGLAAAPEIAIAVPRVMPPPYFSVDRYPTRLLPECKGVTVNGAALRSCQASCACGETIFRAMLMTCSGRHPSGSVVGPPSPCLYHSDDITGLSLGSNPVNGSGRRSSYRHAPRNARVRRLRYRACRENQLMFTNGVRIADPRLAATR